MSVDHAWLSDYVEKIASLMNTLQALDEEDPVAVAYRTGRRQDTLRRLARVFARSRPRIWVPPHPRNFQAEIGEDARQRGVALGFDVNGEGPHDLMIVQSNWCLGVGDQQYREELVRLRRDNPDAVSVILLVDNHHMYRLSLQFAHDFDVVVSAHDNGLRYLSAVNDLVFSGVPCGAKQWSSAQAAEFYPMFEGRPRSDKLYGKFFEHEGQPRNAVIRRYVEAMPDQALLLRPVNVAFGEYLALTPEEKFREWMGYKVSLCVSVRRDMPYRLFEALLTGQIPLVASDVQGFDALIDPETQRRLPVVRYAEATPEAVARAHRVALELYDAEGAEGARRRHAYALQHHMFANRILRIAEILRWTARTL